MNIFMASVYTTKTTGKEHINMSNEKNTSSKKQGKSSVSDNTSNYKYNPGVENPNPKASNKATDNRNK
jgi:hypothetical protein